MKILMLHRQQSAVGYYRTFLPARALKAAGHDVTYFPEGPYYKVLKPNLEKWLAEHLNQFDLLVVDRALEWQEAAYFAGYRHYSKDARLLIDFDDDFTKVPNWNPAYNKYQPGQECFAAGMGQLRLAEGVSVSTETLKKRFDSKAHKVFCAPNYIDPAEWEGLAVNPERKLDDSVYVLYGGASGHYGDLDEVKLGLEAVLRNPPVKMRLICFGSLPGWLHELSRAHPGRIITLPWVPFESYPQAIAWGGFDLALAPLADHPFNEAKSLIKALESGLQKIPLLCSDVGPYKEIPDGCAIKVDNTPAQWAESFRALLQDAALRKSLETRAYQWVKDTWTLDNPSNPWHIIVEEVCKLPRIESLEATRLPGDPPPPPTELPEMPVTKGVVSVPDPQGGRTIVGA